MLKDNGRSSDSDFAVIQIGGMPEQLTALRTKALDAAVLNAELTIVARKEGFRKLSTWRR
jgi:hypothetical protein